MPRIHNISDKTLKTPMAVNIGLLKIMPGTFKEVPSESINAKVEALHGHTIWIGDLLPRQLHKKQVKPRPISISREAATDYLKKSDISKLKVMLAGVTPAIPVAVDAPHRRYVYALSAACFSKDYELDPELFYWLGRWEKLPNGDYKEV
jgi:hypothetical protein